MAEYGEYYRARKLITEIVRKDLIGPVTEDEILIEYPSQYYVMGKLYPCRGNHSSPETEEGSSALKADVYDSALASANLRNPSSMGITFTVKPGISQFNVTVSYAKYDMYSYEDREQLDERIEKYQGQLSEKTRFWVRNPRTKHITLSAESGSTEELEERIFLKSYIHRTSRAEGQIVTVILINDVEASGSSMELMNQAMLFQPELTVFAENGEEIFASVQKRVARSKDSEELEFDMLYADNKCYGMGHGCAAEWNMERPEPDYVKTSFMPEYELHQMKAAGMPDIPIFNMKYLFTEKPEKIIQGLTQFMDCYAEWIAGLQEKQMDVYSVPAENNRQKCREMENRIRGGISILEKSAEQNGNAWKAFRYANEAMYMQRVQTLLKNGKEISDGTINWYPFQLAFILLEISSTVDSSSDERELVDLLWFPTGGGKTEAYLGIAAFTIFYRRMSQKNGENGVTVIMRYTLRLLTIQQFERASMLICACEILRKKYRIPGEEITIGMWVGNSLTPQKLKDAARILDKLRMGAVIANGEPDPCQVKVCPWCGERLYYPNYQVDPSEHRMKIRCSNKKCAFHGEAGLPILLTDEEIYSFRPTYLVATVDKFAQVTLNERAASIFSVDGKNLPPELIIQDELHLISGPLGTIVGLYEAAFTQICSRVKPVKIVASTATIQNAEKQIRALYGRKFAQFPPQGICADDSFFAVKSGREERPARLYVGCMGTGTSFMSTIIRLYASWLFASRYLIDHGFDEKVIDNFWTLTGYFNTVQSLGNIQSQIVDAIQSRYQYLRASKFKEVVPPFTGAEKYEYSIELTSQISNEEISDIIQSKLKIPYQKENHKDAFDFVLASNMISVGVDVGRLGTMVVAGQPKTNAEYIQATSRIGRDNPGLVFVVYNEANSRDRSHYEGFLKYHSAIYRYVEATSLTPFSERARDRALQALFVTLCRCLCPDLLANDSAGNFDPSRPEIKKIEEMIFQYVSIVDERERGHVMQEIHDIEKKWYAQTDGMLYYRLNKENSLLKSDIEENSRFRCMNSMRNVERQSGIYLKGEEA